MMFRNLILFSLLFAGFTQYGAYSTKAQDVSLKSSLKPAVKEGGFKMDGYFLWCPSVIKVDDISTKMKTGYAWADKITGPWTRISKPAIHVTNPAILVRSDNTIYVIGRGEGPEKTNIATAFKAPKFDGEYSMLKEGKNVLPDNFELEDPTIWWANNQYNILVNDWKAKATGISKAGAQYYSKDGLSYTLVSKEPVFTKTVEFDDHTAETFKRRERPFVYVNEKNEVIAFFTTCLPDKPVQLCCSTVLSAGPVTSKGINVGPPASSSTTVRFLREELT